MWILGTFPKEFAFLYFPAIIGVFLGYLIPDLGTQSLVYGILATGIIDSGHVYTTLWRIYFHPEERKSHYSYWLFPVSFFVLFALWFYLEIPHLWPFVVYATLFHHVRQVYGLSKWYQKLNGRQDKISDRFLYAFSFLPMVIYHFRPEAIARYYTDNDLFLFPDTRIKTGLLILYVLVLISWVAYEWSLTRKGIHELNRVASVGFPAGIYASCFLVGTTVTQILFPLLLLHGIAYIAIVGQSVTRTRKILTAPVLAFSVMILTAVTFGLGELWFEENIVDYEKGDSPILMSALVGIWLTPLFCHYAFDALIWRKDHREASLVFSKH